MVLSIWPALRDVFPLVRWAIVRLIVILALGFFYFWASLVLYALFYWYYIPPVYHIQPTHFQFSSGCSRFRPVCSFPQAQIALRGRETLLVSGEEYSVSITLELPDSYVNRNLGMFMVNLTLYSEEEEILLTAGRHFLLRYQSTMIRIMSRLLYSIPLLLGFSEEKQTLSAVLVENYIDNAYRPAKLAVITVTSKEIEIYRGTVRFDAHFSGLRYLMYYWPITTAVYTVFNLVGIMLAGTVLLWFALLSFWSSNENQRRNRANRAPQTVGRPSAAPTGQQQMHRSSSAASLAVLQAGSDSGGGGLFGESRTRVSPQRQGFRISEEEDNRQSDS